MTPSLPVVDPPDEEPTGSSRVAGLLLAAGTSTRYGSENKLLATVDGEPLVRRAARTLLDATVDPVIIVTGHERHRVENALSGLDLRFVHNPDYELGQATSVATGIDALPETIDAVVIALGDMPSVDSRSIDALVAAFEHGQGSALAAGYEGTRGNPVLFARRHFDDLADVSGDVGGRGILLESTDAAVVETGDPGVMADIDVPADHDT